MTINYPPQISDITDYEYALRASGLKQMDVFSKKKAYENYIASSMNVSAQQSSITTVEDDMGYTKWGAGYHGLSRKSFKINIDKPTLSHLGVINAIATDLSAWSMGSISEKESFGSIVQILQENNGNIESLTPLFEKWTINNDKKRWLFTDIETNSLNAGSGDIIEVAMILTDSQGAEVDRFERIYNVDSPEFLDATGGNFLQHVHNIQRHQISKQPSFIQDADTVNIVASLLNDPNNIVVSHNKDFENSWYSQYVPGYWKAHQRLNNKKLKKRVGELDTQTLTKLLCNTERIRLQDFVESQGFEYTGAHRAMRDTEMMMDAMFALRSKILSNK